MVTISDSLVQIEDDFHTLFFFFLVILYSECLGVLMVKFLHGDFSVKGNHTEEGVLEKFKEETRERGIPEENVMNILETGSGIKLFF